MRGVLSVSLAACGLAMTIATASAAGDPNAVSGLLAEKCANCHEIPGYEARWGRADVNAPPFERIAKDPAAYPPEQLRAFLQKPHWPMGQFILSPSDIDNVMAFIDGLR
ncbi:MAG: hypothetical protein R3D05_05075 [Dongiaceae bacterium]